MNKGTDQPLRGKSKQVFPACLPSTTPLVSLTYVSAVFCGNNPMQTQKQLLTVTAQLQNFNKYLLPVRRNIGTVLVYSLMTFFMQIQST